MRAAAEVDVVSLPPPAPSNALLALLSSYASSFTVRAAAEVYVVSLPPPAPSEARSVKKVKLEA